MRENRCGRARTLRAAAISSSLFRIQSTTRPSEAQLNLHGPAAVAREFKGRLHVVEAVTAGQKRLHVHGAAVDEVDGQAELLVEPERAANLDLLGDHHVLRN